MAAHAPLTGGVLAHPPSGARRSPVDLARRARFSRPRAMRQDVVAPRVGGSPAPRWVAPRGVRHRASASSNAPRSAEGARAFFRRCPPGATAPLRPDGWRERDGAPSLDVDDFDDDEYRWSDAVAASPSHDRSRARRSASTAATAAMLSAVAAGVVAGAASPARAADGRHSRSKLRETEERRWEEQNRDRRTDDRAEDKVVRVDNGAVTVDFKNAGAEVKSLGDRVKRAHKRAMKKLKRKVDKTVSGLNNGGDKPATFRTAQRSMQPGGYYGRSGYGYAGPPPWIGGLLGWVALFGAAWAVTKVFGLGGGFRLPSLGGGRKRRPPGAGPGRWVKDRTLGGREIWVEDRYAKGARGNALAESLSTSSGLSEAADKARRKEEAKAAAAAAAASDAVPPAWWSPPSPGYCPESQREARLTRARAALAALGATRVGGQNYTEADLADLRDACAAAGASVADRVKPESARAGIFKAGVEFALEAAARRSSTGMIGPPTTFLTGLAEDVGFAPGKAGRAVVAAVAARVRAELLQAGAQMRQGEDGAAMMTLDAVIGVLATFPPERNSPEFEMIAAGLAPRLNQGERDALLRTFESIGGGDASAAVAEALGVRR